MRILNLRIYLETQTIKVTLDTLRLVEYLKNVVEPPVISIHDRMADKYFYNHGSLRSKRLGDVDFVAEYKQMPTRVLVTGERYRLPTNRQQAFDFLSCLDDHMKYMQFDLITFNQLTFVDLSIEEFLVSGKEISSPLKKVMEHILAINSAPDYQDVQHDLKKICDWYAVNHDIDMGRCISASERYGILLESLGHENLLSDQSTLVQKTVAIFSMIKKCLSMKNEISCEVIIDTLHKRAKKELFRNAIGKDSLDPVWRDSNGKMKPYTWNFTEWYVIRDGEFSMRPDGRMCIRLNDNPGYKDNYARHPDQTIFEREFKHLGNVIGFEFANDSDFKKEVIFTAGCTKKLMAKWLHLNVDYFKNLLKISHHAGFFAQLYRNTSPLNDAGINYMSWLPPEVVKYITREADKEIYQQLDANDAREVTELTWARYQ
ncbi:MAG: hypothetical protein A3F11_06010 [Gammaproteobacteria bacterium RIFCSPHIGHO2_12_FULL_37_14]|nr:MAG: hypothetical protein A3F11_06010 [Gammaproteobacteria bacterium RIFCSPHIGHO2_12_FULL_37_14]